MKIIIIKRSSVKTLIIIRKPTLNRLIIKAQS